jgi:hypothetical protein
MWNDGHILGNTKVGRTPLDERPDAQASTTQHTTLTTDKHPHSGGIRTHNPSKRAVANPRLRPRAHSLLLPSHTSDRTKQGKHKLQSAKRYTHRLYAASPEHPAQVEFCASRGVFELKHARKRYLGRPRRKLNIYTDKEIHQDWLQLVFKYSGWLSWGQVPQQGGHFRSRWTTVAILRTGRSAGLDNGCHAADLL